MHNFRELHVWKKSRLFVKDVYELSTNFPVEEKFGLVAQIRRASISISLNISEGSGRSTKSFINFLRNAYSSALKVETILILANDLELISEEVLNQFIEKAHEIQKMIFGLIKKLKSDLKQ